MKIVFCSSEVFPFAKTGGLADVSGALPLVLGQMGMDVVVVLPRYRGIDEKGDTMTRLNKDILSSTMGEHVRVFFIEHEDYFEREDLYGNAKGDYKDNLERFAFFSRRTLSLLKQINLKADIIHCNDWQTALIPVYLKTLMKNDPFFENMLTILTIHNLAYQGVFPKEEYVKIGLSRSLFDTDGFEFYDKINLLKAGIVFADSVTTVSPQYAQEIQTEDYGCGLDDVLRQKGEIMGILNGLDNDLWNPKTDRFIKKKYSKETCEDKVINKRELQRECGWEQKDDVPLFGFVGRLDYQKGIELIAETMDEIFQSEVQMVILGTGEQKYQRELEIKKSQYSKKLSVHLKFDEHLAHMIYAGSDIFLMPSRYEPCGLSQMISLRYGAVPLVYKTGGLADTVCPFISEKNQGNGFVFDEYTKEAFYEVIHKALDCFHHKEVFRRLVQKTFDSKFSWGEAARKYRILYEQCMSLV